MAITLGLRKILQVQILTKTFYRYFKEDRVRDLLLHRKKSVDPGKHRKVSIFGASGNVGAACANNLLLKNVCDEIILVDTLDKKDQLCAEALDYAHFASLKSHPQIKICFNSDQTRDSDVIVVCAGQKSFTEYPEEVLNANAEIFRKHIPKLAALSKDAVILVVSDPVDIMAYAAWKYSGFDKNRIIGTGTELDSSRFRYVIGKRLGISPKSINAWVIGEHGKNGVPCWSTVDIGGTRLIELHPNIGTKEDRDHWYNLYEQVSESGSLLRSMKGNCKWSISAIIENFVEAVLFNSRTVHAVSINCKGLYGIDTDTFLSLPAVLGNRGVVQIVKQTLSPSELHSFQESVNYLNCLKKVVAW